MHWQLQALWMKSMISGRREAKEMLRWQMSALKLFWYSELRVRRTLLRPKCGAAEYDGVSVR